MLEPIQQKSSMAADGHSSQNQSPQRTKKKPIDKTKFSRARRAADQHSIIFEEDLDSEGELDTSTYHKYQMDEKQQQ